MVLLRNSKTEQCQSEAKSLCSWLQYTRASSRSRGSSVRAWRAGSLLRHFSVRFMKFESGPAYDANMSVQCRDACRRRYDAVVPPGRKVASGAKRLGRKRGGCGNRPKSRKGALRLGCEVKENLETTASAPAGHVRDHCLAKHFTRQHAGDADQDDN